MKKKNPADLTQRNLRAMTKQLAAVRHLRNEMAKEADRYDRVGACARRWLDPINRALEGKPQP